MPSRQLNIFSILAIMVFGISSDCIAAKASTTANRAPDPVQSTVALKSAPKTIPASSPLVIGALKPSDLAKASGMVGKQTSVVGIVEKAYSPDDHHIVYLDFDKDYKKDISVVALESAFSKLPDLTKLQGCRVLISGKIDSYHNKPEILLNDASQITLVK